MVEDSPRSNGVALAADGRAPRLRRGASDFIVLGHDSRLAQVVTNLIDNACSFSEAGGEVRVALRRAPASPTVEGQAAGDEVRHRRRRRRAGHPAPRARAHLRALLHRPARAGLRPEFRPRTVDLAPDRRSSWRPDLGGEPPRRRRARAPADGRGDDAATAPARASSSLCRRSRRERDAWRIGAARERAAGRRERGAGARPLGRRQERADLGACSQAPAIVGLSPPWSATTGSISRVRAGRLLARGAADFAGQIERRGRGVIGVATSRRGHPPRRRPL